MQFWVNSVIPIQGSSRSARPRSAASVLVPRHDPPDTVRRGPRSREWPVVACRHYNESSIKCMSSPTLQDSRKTKRW